MQYNINLEKFRDNPEYFRLDKELGFIGMMTPESTIKVD